MKRLGFLILLIPMLANSDPQHWMKKQNPNELGVYAFVSDKCPIDSDELNEDFENVLVRSRLKPISWFISDPSIHLRVQCFPFREDPNFFDMILTIDFVFTASLTDGTETYMRFGTEPHLGGMTRGRKDYLQSSVRDYMEDAITDYLKANFDLGEDE